MIEEEACDRIGEDDKRPIILERRYCERVKDGSWRAAPSIQSTMQMKELLFPLLLVSQCHVTVLLRSLKNDKAVCLTDAGR
ncbi:unnamed protein product [Brugia pahangi]|uniref:Uncharacterized protein n=1 Tax=Brugia pahangi TaxID=6280 RepID=A0A0N4TIN4_BRUPA|nr:unnamed protein product [Brugia pahangi]